MGLTGLILIVLGAICIAKPGPILLSLSWLAGILIMCSGLSRLITWALGRANGLGGLVMFNGIFQILVGALFIRFRAILTSAMGIILIVLGVFYFLTLFGMTRFERIVRKSDGTTSHASSDSYSETNVMEFNTTADRESEWIDEQ